MPALDDVVQTFQKWLYLPKPDALLATLGTVAANRLPGDPVWLLVVGPPGGGKSEILQSLMTMPDIRGIATITERALLSGTAKKERDADAKGGVLRELGGFGILVAKDFGSLLSMNREERNHTMAALREIYDGSWRRDLGVDGGRHLYWQGKIGLIAGVTPSIDQHHQVMGAMGERFMLLRLPIADPMALADKALEHAGREAEMRGELQDAVSSFFSSLNGCAPMALEREERERLKSLATLVVRGRSAVERDAHHRDVVLIPGSEAPTRLVVALDRLLLGLRAIGVDDARAWEIITAVALDSMPQLRRSIIETLFLMAGEEMRTSEVAKAVRYPTNTTRRALEDLTAHHVVDREGEGEEDEKKSNTHAWTLSTWAAKRLEQAKSPRSRNVGSPVGRPPSVPSYPPLSVVGDITGTGTEPAPAMNGAAKNGTVDDDVWTKPFDGNEPPVWQ